MISMKHLYSFSVIFFWGLEGSLCGAQFPQKVTGNIQSSCCKFVNFYFTNILICYNYIYIYNYTVIIRLNSFFNFFFIIFYLSKIFSIW